MKRIEKKLDRMAKTKVICYLRGYDYCPHCRAEKIYKDSNEAERVCKELNRNPGTELHYKVECEIVTVNYL